MRRNVVRSVLVATFAAATVLFPATVSTAVAATTAQSAATEAGRQNTPKAVKIHWSPDKFSCQTTRRDYGRYYNILTACEYGYLAGYGDGWMFSYETR
ncbi:hypothetical protein WEH80_37060 [Actinomycetes bacterium KLBMP 9759]